MQQIINTQEHQILGGKPNWEKPSLFLSLSSFITNKISYYILHWHTLLLVCKLVPTRGYHLLLFLQLPLEGSQYSMIKFTSYHQKETTTHYSNSPATTRRKLPLLNLRTERDHILESFILDPPNSNTAQILQATFHPIF